MPKHLSLFQGQVGEVIVSQPYGLEDLLALPAPASAEAEVKLGTQLSKNVTLNAPLVAAPMDTVTEARMAIACALMGGIGVIHCNCSPAEQAKQVDLVKKWENGFIMDPFVLSQTHTVADLDNIRQKHDASTVCITDMGMMGNRPILKMFPPGFEPGASGHKLNRLTIRSGNLRNGFSTV
ncbi:impdh [Symbiodinium natans]|uniref:Impdh protein n=1 Tax=Symbiodinium natans TaxID=878477 RepID=A0A812UNN2_9DINO|nr:impdh [Symbiodinium natans]